MRFMHDLDFSEALIVSKEFQMEYWGNSCVVFPIESLFNIRVTLKVLK